MKFFYVDILYTYNFRALEDLWLRIISVRKWLKLGKWNEKLKKNVMEDNRRAG